MDKENVLIKITVGRGYGYKKAINLAQELNAKNIQFLNSILYAELANLIANCDLCLGIFGNTEKTKRVIPNKVYESIVMAQATISADMPAIRELFRDKENILLCKTADQKSLTEKILMLKNDEKLRNKIAASGYELFVKNCTPKVIGKKLLEELKNL